jgi:hypothetical protein
MNKQIIRCIREGCREPLITEGPWRYYCDDCQRKAAAESVRKHRAKQAGLAFARKRRAAKRRAAKRAA